MVKSFCFSGDPRLLDPLSSTPVARRAISQKTITFLVYKSILTARRPSEILKGASWDNSDFSRAFVTINIYNLLILVGAIHGMLLSILLVVSKRHRRSSKFLLALLLTFYTLPVLKSVLQDLGLFSLYAPWSWPIELLYGLGPSLYFYVRTVADEQFSFRKSDYLHFLPVLLEILYYASPLYREPTTYGLTRVEDGRHLIWIVQQIGSMLSVLVYLIATHRLLRIQPSEKQGGSDEHRRTQRWLRIPVGLYSLFFGLWLGLRWVDVLFFGDRLDSAPYYPLLLFLSISTYWIGTQGYLEFQLPHPQPRHDPPSSMRHSETEPHPDIEDPTLEQIFLQLKKSMVDDRIYRKNDLSLTDLAEHLAINPRLLSKVINVKAGVHFYDYINRFRVEEFKRRVAEPGPRTTLLDLANECGFGSKATFNTAFKKSTGLTPSQYRKQVRTSDLPDDSDTDDSRHR